ncbi:unnamed protein product [Litomosoides sigmodontis]|uniref:Protein kinase domain-containing protein n=1 Tax=Litomosoides sigmodontis TaxID=42156 RepID=A0A3P6T6L2_LITSI|nr:unnamed protein product [Litomosoides sigmodontis]
MMINSSKEQMPVNGALSLANFKIRIEAEFCGEKFCFEMDRPLMFDELQMHLELLDLDRTAHQRSLRLLLYPLGQNGSSASSGVVFADFDEHYQKDLSTPCAPTNWKQGKRIGSGTFGRVYVCVDVATGKEVALKRLNICRGNGHLRNHIIQLGNEINLLSTIQHDRIVQHLDVEQIDNSICFFIEYMTGGSVKDCVASGAVAATTFIGTPNYMAPEVVLGRRRHGRKADIWSVGCTSVEMLTKQPRGDLEPIAIIFNIAKHNPSYQLPLATDPNLTYLISIIFERDVEKRPGASQLLNYFTSHKCLSAPLTYH